MVSAIYLDFFSFFLFFHVKTPNEKMCLFEYLWVIKIQLAQAGDLRGMLQLRDSSHSAFRKIM